MSMKKLLLGLLLLSIGTFMFAQQRNCGSMEYLEQQNLINPDRIDKLREVERHTQQYLQNPQRAVNGVVTIPVVVHVVYYNSTQNISDAQIQSQIDVLNEDFRRMNSDADNTWPQAADSEIEFCLATIDPQGNPTNGITRTSTNVNGFGTNDNMKFNSQGGKDAWPASDYMNMWVCNISGGILGYAQFPGGPSSTDGVVIDYQYFGTIGTATSPFDLGRTATHEVGHYLNLRHIWGDGNCSVDDFVSDTPNSDNPNYGCATGHVSCSSTDMVQNYMDYSDDACMNLFTAGQNTRMRALFDVGGFRQSLMSSGACGTPADPTCDDGIQNGNETGVDCGGPDCPACPPCNENMVTVTINLDNYPEETSWTITADGGGTVASGGTYGSQPDGSTVNVNVNLSEGCYTFTIFDSYGDGICCGYGNGSYVVADGCGNLLASGGSFGSSEATSFCVGGGPAPTCNDGIQNGNETGVDCGGPDCPACPTCNDGVQNGNETGVDCGGPDCPACPTCNDGIQNGDETDVDCGGSCPACPTCNDGIQNGDETGIDCGGSDCPACPTCNDGIQNGNETGVDCGGSCPACPTCNDGVQNGNETGVDCGGPDCAPCSGCDENLVTITINLDNYPEETSWTITADGGGTVASGGTYGSQPDGSTVSVDVSLADGCYTFTIFDSYGDGICCSYGNGSYVVADDCGTLLASGGSFGSSEATSFCIGSGPVPTCNDGIQNGNETGVDCGGPDCPPCGDGGCTDQLVDYNDFEGGWGIWNDGGSDCQRSSSDASYAAQGIYCVRLRDNTSSSTMTTDNINLSSYDEITVNFAYYPRSMDNSSEDFWLQISTNGGSTYSTVEEWNLNDEFVNDNFYSDGVTIQGPFSSNTRLRFRCDASGNSDYVYIDQVEIRGCNNGARIASDNVRNTIDKAEVLVSPITDLNLFPNPTNAELTVAFEAAVVNEVQLFLTDFTGKVVSTQQLDITEGPQQVKLDVSQMAPGFYFVHLIAGKDRITKKFVVAR